MVDVIPSEGAQELLQMFRNATSLLVCDIHRSLNKMVEVIFNDRYGYIEKAETLPGIRKCVKSLLRSIGSEEFIHADEEHSDVYITRGDDTLTVYVNGLINAGSFAEDVEKYLYGVPFSELGDLMIAFARADRKTLAEYEWCEDKSSLNRSEHPLYLHASDESMTELHRAVCQGDASWVKSAIDRGIDVNVKDSEGNTPLYLAVLIGKPEISKLLVKLGADITATDNSGCSVLDLLETGLESKYFGKAAKKMIGRNKQ